MLNDYMCRFLLWYSTALVAAITIRSTGGDANNLCLRRLNRSLTVISCLNVLGIVWLHQLSQVTVESRYFVVLLSCHVLAISISVWSCQPTTLPTSKQPAKWSMPGTALFGALVRIALLSFVVGVVWSALDCSPHNLIACETSSP